MSQQSDKKEAAEDKKEAAEHAKHAKEDAGYRDSLGQPNPAYGFEKRNIEEAKERIEKESKEAKENPA